ncbi:unnamed protein product [Orchesella dallaii]|uniref:Uncharacterized protein n=1 Tax=Orchesella dallaii TaxID=48710 RepID=A0ABP1RP53_9HEXA
MLIQDNLEKLINLNFKVHNFVSLPIHEFNKESGKLVVISRMKQQLYKIKLFLISLVVLTMWYQLGHAWNDISTTSLIQSIFYSIGVALHLPMILELHKKRNEISDLYNAMTTFEKGHAWALEKANTRMDVRTIMANLMGFLAVITAPGISALAFLQFFWIPCLPCLIGYNYLPECNLKEYDLIQGIIMKAVLLAIEMSLILFTCTGVFLEYGIYSYIHCYCLLDYLRILKSHLALGCRFLSAPKIGKLYRQVQLLTFSYNNIHQKILTTFSSALMQSICTLCLFAIIKFGDELILPVILMFWVLVGDLVLYTFDSEGAVKANLFKTSKDILRDLKCVAMGIALHLPMILELYKKRNEISDLYNAMTTFEKGHAWALETAISKMDFRTIMAKLFGILGVITAPGISALVLLQLFWIPCLPCLIGYNYLPECNHKEYDLIQGIIMKAVLLAIEMSLILFTCTGIFLEYTIYSYIHCYCLLDYLRKLKSHLALGCRFLSAPKIGKLYRQVQLLTFSYNNIHQKILTTFSSALMQSVCTLALFAIIKFGDELILPVILMFWVLVGDLVLYTFDSEGAVKSNLFKTSKDILHDLKCVAMGTQNSRWLRRYVKSLPVLKIGIGSGNFYDELTPLVLIDFSINQTVSLLLM